MQSIPSKNALLDARWLAMGLLGISNSGENPFPPENRRGQDAFQKTLRALHGRLEILVRKYRIRQTAPPLLYDMRKVVVVRNMLSRFLAESADAAGTELLELVPEFISPGEFIFHKLSHVHDHLMEIALAYFVYARATFVNEPRTPDEEASRQKTLTNIQAQKDAITRISSDIRAIRDTDWWGEATERTRLYRIKKAFAATEPEPTPRGRQRLTKKDDSIAKERTALLNAYIEEGKRGGRKITDRMIAEAARPTWHERTPVQRWKRNDPRTTEAADTAIRRVLADRPHLK